MHDTCLVSAVETGYDCSLNACKRIFDLFVGEFSLEIAVFVKDHNFLGVNKFIAQHLCHNYGGKIFASRRAELCGVVFIHFLFDFVKITVNIEVYCKICDDTFKSISYLIKRIFAFAVDLQVVITSV